jgi:hypothetical protein
LKKFLLIALVLVLPFSLFAAGGALFKQGVKLTYDDGQYYQNDVKVAFETAEIALQYYNKASALKMESARSLRNTAGTLLVVGNTMLMFGVTATVVGSALGSLEAIISGAGISTGAALVDLVALITALSGEGQLNKAVSDYNNSLDNAFDIRFINKNAQTYGILIGTDF